MGLDSALALIESVADNTVLFVGDRILDEYQYVRPLGKSPKEHLIPVRHLSKELFMGGVDAAAKHAASFVKEVRVASFGPVTRKVRMVDETYLRKLFEVHYIDGDQVNVPLAMDGLSCVVVTDFGHGAITPFAIQGLCSSAPYLAVNAQTNSANVGFNLITKYPKADYIVIDEPEARLAAADRDSPIDDVLRKLGDGRCRRMVITLGTHGAIGGEQVSNGWEIYSAAAFTDRVIDTMGAGDAFFAVTAPMARIGTMQDLLMIGNAAGALKTQIVGHRKPVTKEALIGYLREQAR